MVRRERTMLLELLILLVFILDDLFFKRKQLASKLTYERETQKVEYNRHAVLLRPDSDVSFGRVFYADRRSIAFDGRNRRLFRNEHRHLVHRRNASGEGVANSVRGREQLGVRVRSQSNSRILDDYEVRLDGGLGRQEEVQIEREGRTRLPELRENRNSGFNERSSVGRVLICGTNAQKPKCIHAEMSNLESGWRRRNATDGLYNCPFAVNQKVTSVFAEGSLYAGTVADFNGRDSALTRSMGNAVPLITKRHDSLWLNHPKFVGSFVEGREVFFFFREVSVENCEKIYRSRIARVCTDDKGGRTILDSSLTTFLKARLDCSFRGEFPFRFNYLQDVVRTVRGGKVFYYAVFTTGKHEIPASAICRFGLDDIRDNFERGPFLRPTAPWGRIPDEDVPDNRPGDCSVDSTLLSYEDLNFVKSHPSLYEPVGSGDPLFTLVRQNYRLKTLTVTET
ncbi:semaphorin-1A-like, partial [Anneissia japonica]|uniref:semaphorin-1A-like n=1 Tax=Anneissia japonica TaxID=1529436 RepID=UPI0014256003